MNKVLKISIWIASISFSVLLFGLLLTFGSFGTLSVAFGIPIGIIGLIGTVMGIFLLIACFCIWLEDIKK